MKRTSGLLAGLFLLISGTAFAQEGHGHDKPHDAGKHHDSGKHHGTDKQMAKLHKMMPKYAVAQARINAALEKRDLTTIAKETEYLLSTTADLKKSRPHKHHADIGEFKRIAASFEKDVRSTAEFARKGEIKAAKAAFARAGERCDACHAKFRD